MGGKHGDESPEDVAARHERIQREAENRGGVAGGITFEDRANVARQGIREDLEARHSRERPLFSGMKGMADEDSKESILDDIDDRHAGTGVMGLAPDEPGHLTAGWLEGIRQHRTRLWLVGAGLGAILVWAIMLNVCREDGGPSTTQGSPTTSAQSTTTEAVTELPLSGSATATASFTRVSGSCNFASTFEDAYSVVLSDGTLTLTQLSNGHMTTGMMGRDGEFITFGGDQRYTGTLRGVNAEGEHTYTGEGCNEIYRFVMELSAPLIP